MCGLGVPTRKDRPSSKGEIMILISKDDGKEILELDIPAPGPQWGPHDGDGWGEPYNRGIAAFQMFNTNWSRWSE